MTDAVSENAESGRRSPLEALQDGDELRISTEKYLGIVSFDIEVWKSDPGGYTARSTISTFGRWGPSKVMPSRPATPEHILKLVAKHGYRIVER